MSGSTIPEDLWTDILKRVPVKIICKMRCVCKSWNDLISSANFITDHHEFMTGSNKNNSSSYRFEMRTHRKPLFALHHQPTNTSTALTHPLPFGPFPTLFAHRSAVVHGVVFLYIRTNHTLVTIVNPPIGSNDMICIWNPVIRRSLIVPWPTRFAYPKLIGFGFDTRSNTFKLVGGIMTGSYQVYSVSDGVWKNRPFPARLNALDICDVGCFMGGSIHWITYTDVRSGPFGLLRFDCEREEFSIIDLPPQVARDQIILPQVFVLPDFSSLALVKCQDTDIDGDDIYELWTLQHEYGTWTQLSRTHPTAAQDIYGPWYNLTPLPSPPSYDYARFRCIYTYTQDYFPFIESLFLMNISRKENILRAL